MRNEMEKRSIMRGLEWIGLHNWDRVWGSIYDYSYIGLDIYRPFPRPLGGSTKATSALWHPMLLWSNF